MDSKIVVAVMAGLLALAIPFIIKKWIEPSLYARSVRKARQELKAAGLTPEQYLATLDQNDSLTVGKAKTRFGL